MFLSAVLTPLITTIVISEHDLLAFKLVLVHIILFAWHMFTFASNRKFGSKDLMYACFYITLTKTADDNEVK